MTLSRLYEMLKTVGLPVAYHHFSKPTKPPFIHYFTASAQSIGADYKNFGERMRVSIDLCTEKRDMELEKRVEQVIDGYSYEKYQLYLDDENIYQTTYEIDIIVKENEYAE